MNYFLLATWGSVIFGVLTVLLLGLWGLRGQTSAPLRIGGGVCGLICMGCAVYTNYLA
jgi:hypothetical protein